MDTDKIDAKTMKIIGGAQLTVVRWTIDENGEAVSSVALGKFGSMGDAIAFCETMAARDGEFAFEFTVHDAKGWRQCKIVNEACRRVVEKRRREFMTALFS